MMIMVVMIMMMVVVNLNQINLISAMIALPPGEKTNKYSTLPCPWHIGV
jgi:hypothetical protein